VAQDFETVDAYIASYPGEVQDVLRELRRRIQQVVPDATEEISYQIPTYKVEGKAFVYFAGWKSHVSLYPVPPLEEPLETEVAAYRSGKDTVRFPLSEPLPEDLVSRIVTAMRDAREDAGR
jgi:uncharacterized protein YdhG (YjbR/CyaY superfamily)